MLSFCSYVGIDPEELRLALLAHGLQSDGDELMETNNENPSATSAPLGSNCCTQSGTENHSVDSSSVVPQEEVLCGSWDRRILKWNLENWAKLSREEKDNILFQFWVKTSSHKFPKTMNLVLKPHPLTNCALAGFMLLFSEGTSIYKKGVRWITMETGEVDTVKTQLIWWDPSNPSNTSKHEVIGMGELLIEILDWNFFGRRSSILIFVSA